MHVWTQKLTATTAFLLKKIKKKNIFLLLLQEDVGLCMKYLLNLRTSEERDKCNSIDLSIK